ncbi:MAG: glycosyltransferase family 2 protein [Acinetobacter junii]|nr:glycosyltransferase family 2 protein [Acinetobacter junii]
MNIENDIKVSVCVVTYNQENYIAQCLESLVNQETNFRYEIIVGEDYSTDSTRAIVQSYVERYPDLIVPLFYKNNIGAVENIKQVYKKAKGKYIAHMDGDDMALPGKLQKQFDILEDNPDCSICVHNMNAVDGSSNSMKRQFTVFDEKKYSLIDMYLINPFFIHSSKMFVNKIDEYIDDLDQNALDIEVHIEQAKQGNIYFLKESLGIYRQFVGVTYEGKLINPLIPARIQDVYNRFEKDKFSLKQVNEVINKYSYILLQYANHYTLRNDFESAKKYVKQSLMIKKNRYSIVFILIFINPCLLKFVLMFFNNYKKQ